MLFKPNHLSDVKCFHQVVRDGMTYILTNEPTWSFSPRVSVAETRATDTQSLYLDVNLLTEIGVNYSISFSLNLIFRRGLLDEINCKAPLNPSWIF